MTKMHAYPEYEEILDIVTPLVCGASEMALVLTEDNEIRELFYNPETSLQRNEAATKIFRANHLKDFPTTPPEDLNAIYGTAVLFGRRVVFSR